MSLALLCGAAIAADAPFTLAVNGTGRACTGGLFVRPRTIEWNSTFSRCRPSPYEIIDRETAGEPRRIAFRLLKRSAGCRYPVIEAEQVRSGSWNVTGYPSLQAWRDRQLDSPSTGQQVLSCPMFEGE